MTSREMDVLLLVRTGVANAEIAQRLFLSPRTVESHVASLLMKSGTANRTELVDWLASTQAGQDLGHDEIGRGTP